MDEVDHHVGPGNRFFNRLGVEEVALSPLHTVGIRLGGGRTRWATGQTDHFESCG